MKLNKMDRICQYEVARAAALLALYGSAHPDLTDRLLEIVQEHQKRCDKKQGRRVGKRVYRREFSTYKTGLTRAAQQMSEADYAHTERLISYAIAHVLDLGVTLGLEEPKPEPTDPAVMIQAEPATQTIQ
jgi:hypothetical protein